jgi:hypothetical protein
MENHSTHKTYSEHKAYCIKQMIRFSEELDELKLNNNHHERLCQFWYCYGRLIQLSEQNNDNFIKWREDIILDYNIDQAIRTIQENIDDSDQKIASIGFAIGFIQEAKGDSQYLWWTPIANLLRDKNWQAINEFLEKNIDFYSKLDLKLLKIPTESWTQINKDLMEKYNRKGSIVYLKTNGVWGYEFLKQNPNITIHEEIEALLRLKDA